MGCYTLYVVRDGPGEPLVKVERYGAYLPGSPADLHAILAGLHTSPYAHAQGAIKGDGALCRGLYADLQARELRFYHCSGGPPPPAVRLQAAEIARMRADPAWSGWDIRYAWDQARELGRLRGEPEPPYEPPALEDVLSCSETRKPEWWTSWDPAARVFTYRYLETAWRPLNAWVTVIAEDGRMHDVGLDAWETIPALLAHGPAVIAPLLAEPPYPPPYEGQVRSGAVIDARARRVVAWTLDAIPAQVAAAWPGWRFERGEGGLPWQLAYTGRNAALYEEGPPEPPEKEAPWDARWRELRGWLAPAPAPQPPPGEGVMYLETSERSIRPGRVFGDPAPGQSYWRRPGAYALIRDDQGRLAVVEVEGHEWHLPGGGIDRGETPEAALIREVREETGLAVAALDLVAEIDERSYSRKEGFFIKAGLYYEARVEGEVGGQIEADHRLIWVTLEEAAARLLCEGQRWLLREAWPPRE